MCTVLAKIWRVVTRSIGVPFQVMTPEASIASLFLIGSTGGGLVCSLSCGRSILTAWVWIGMVMINMMSRTSMTSINGVVRSEEHTSELQSLMRISYAVFCLKKKKTKEK